jgi:Sap, sulfolipid-1-addressing protein
MMWATVLFLGLGVVRDPIRLGIAVFLMSRRRAVLNLLAFWLGGMLAGISLAMAVLVVLRHTALVVIQNAASTFENVRSTVPIFTGGRLQITLGVLWLVILVGVRARQRARAGIPGGDASALALQPRTPTAFSRLSARAQDMLESGIVWPVFVAGYLSTVPPIEAPVVLTAIMASGAAIGTQFSAFVVFTVIALAFIEIPLVAYLAMPQKTQAVALLLHDWIRAHRRRIFETMLAVMGIVLVVKGMASL